MVVLGECPVADFLNEDFDRLNCNLTLGYGSDVNYAKGRVGTPDQMPETKQHMLEVKTQISWVVNASAGWSGTFDVMGVHNPALVVGYVFVAYNYSDYGPYVRKAEQCVLTPCERTYALSAVSGRVNAEVVDINYGSSIRYEVPEVGKQSRPNQTVNELCWQAETGDLTFNATQDAGWRYFSGVPTWAPRWENTTHSGFCPLSIYQAKIAASLTGFATSSDSWSTVPGMGLDAYWDWLEENPYYLDEQGESDSSVIFSSAALQRITATNLSTVVNGIAASLTKLGLDESNATVYGNITTTEVYVRASGSG